MPGHDPLSRGPHRFGGLNELSRPELQHHRTNQNCQTRPAERNQHQNDQIEVSADDERHENEQRQQDAEILAYNQMMEQRKKEEEAEKSRIEEEKKRNYIKVVEETQAQTESKEEYDTLRNMLWEEELEAKQKKADVSSYHSILFAYIHNALPLSYTKHHSVYFSCRRRRWHVRDN